MPSAAHVRIPNREPGWEQEHLLQIPWKRVLDTSNVAVWGKDSKGVPGIPYPSEERGSSCASVAVGSGL